MNLSPDHLVYWQSGFFKLNATILNTWALMLLMIIGAFLITRRLSTGVNISRWQSVLEIIVLGIKRQLIEVGLHNPEKYIGFIGTLFLFISVASLCTVIPGYIIPTSSLSTTTALAVCVFISVPFFGIMENGVKAYMKSYMEPTFIMLPFNIISEFTRTLALAVRLFGNMMSGEITVAILLTITPFIFPTVMSMLGLLIGMVQAYIFSILATVFIAGATLSRET